MKRLLPLLAPLGGAGPGAALPPGYYFLRAHTATGQLLAGGQQIIVAP